MVVKGATMLELVGFACECYIVLARANISIDEYADDDAEDHSPRAVHTNAQYVRPRRNSRGRPQARHQSRVESDDEDKRL
jgi:hypothetical protein